MDFLGAPYPITATARGLLRTQRGLNQIKSDLLILLLTNPGERVMLPDFGTPLRTLIFEPNDTVLAATARQMIIDSIRTWEPRVTIDAIEITTNLDGLDPTETTDDLEHVLGILIRFFDPEDIGEIQELRLEIPLSGG